jgi:threonine/homoserine/homoserine lactone efflux protein
MPDLASLPKFFLASIILLLTPGPAVLYIITRSIDQGRIAGLVSVLSVEVGNLFHAIIAAYGLSALLGASETAFNAVKYLGAVFLFYLGINKLFSRSTQVGKLKTGEKHQSLGQIFRQGLTVAILNPKTALFFITYLPQFVNPTHGAARTQLLTFGCMFVTMAIFSDGAYALLASSAGCWLSTHNNIWSVERYVVGMIYIGLGVTAAMASLPGN